MSSINAVQPASVPASKAVAPRHIAEAWTNPAAAAALRTSNDMLRQAEDGVTKNFNDVVRARQFTVDLRASNDLFADAQQALSTDAHKENDQFLPLITRASNGVTLAFTRLDSKDITNTWPAERSEILNAIRSARMISDNVAKQLDPAS